MKVYSCWGIGACLFSAKKAYLNNLHLICHDAVEVLKKIIPDTSLALVQLFFLDTWHIIRQDKHRIIQEPLLSWLNAGHNLW
ncbi:hypothetical protein [Sodalis endosymbiont of Henestaris halophilus]